MTVLPAAARLARAERVSTSGRTEPAFLKHLPMRKKHAASFAGRQPSISRLGIPPTGRRPLRNALRRMHVRRPVMRCMGGLGGQFGEILRAVIILDVIQVVDDLVGQDRILGVNGAPYDVRSLDSVSRPDVDITVLVAQATLPSAIRRPASPMLLPFFGRHRRARSTSAYPATVDRGRAFLRPAASENGLASGTGLGGFHVPSVTYTRSVNHAQGGS